MDKHLVGFTACDVLSELSIPTLTKSSAMPSLFILKRKPRGVRQSIPRRNRAETSRGRLAPGWR